MRKLFLFLSLLLAACQSRTDLSGPWEFSLDPEGVVSADASFTETIVLPGTTDLAGKGTPAQELELETGHLTRRFSYVGKAWYRREVTVPRRWKDQELLLFLERTKATRLYVDGQPAGECNDVSTPQVYKLSLSPGKHTLALCVDNGGGVPEGVIKSSHLYSEDTQTNWNGVIGRLELAPKETFSASAVSTRMPRLEVVDGRFEADGHPVFLRGKHDACVFPLTGHTPMDKASWLQYFLRCREYGINHVRFHSWCPPEAAFEAADQLGVYLQPELPFWGTLEGEELIAFLTKEGLNILKTYGHHPSFAIFSLGNELWGEPEVMQEMIRTFRAQAPQILYTNGTNAFLGYKGYVEGTDLMATCRTRGEAFGQYDTHVRSSFAFCDALDGGILNHFYPGTRRNFASALQGVPVPVVSHETGQFQSYPDYTRLSRYEGTPFIPCNLLEFRRRLEEAGMGLQAEDFHRASVSWAFQLYKADVEMCLRTPGLGGFQLLDLQDYPGQGSAYVGVLDAFMKEKEGVSPAAWREFCSEVVPLAEFDKYAWSSDEIFRAHLKLARFSHRPITRIEWSLSLGEGASGVLPIPEGEGLLDLRDIEMDLSGISKPESGELTISVYTKGKEVPAYKNHWPLWVYPADNEPDQEGITVVHRLDASARKVLEEGGKVLLMPSDTAGTVGGLFQTDYWNYRMFKQICEGAGKPVSPGTLGILTDPQHPLFEEFPTQEGTSWQWFPILKASRPAILDGLEGVHPIVQVIDNVERNHKLGLLYEVPVEKGHLLVCCSNLEEIQDTPEGRQFYKAVLDYMRSEDTFEVYDLRCEGLSEPLATDSAQPHFSWKIRSGKPMKQAAYEIEVGPDLWLSGPVKSPDQVMVAYGGTPLKARQEGWWRVRVWNEEGQVSPWSRKQRFGVGPLDGLQGEWIGAVPGEQRAPMLRKQFVADKPMRGLLYVTSLGYHEAFLNGKKLSESVLQPAVSQLNKRSLIVAYEVFLEKGENQLRIDAGSGWYKKTTFGTVFDGPLVKAELCVEGKPLVCTDASWEGAWSGYRDLGSWTPHEFGGEAIDAGFESVWGPVEVVEVPGVESTVQMCPPVRVLETLTPISVEKLGGGRWLLDYGQIVNALMDIELPQLPAGTVVKAFFSDFRHPDGHLEQDTRGRDEYIASGKPGGDRFRNRFNHHLMRYVLLEGLPGKPVPEHFKALRIGDSYAWEGRFESTDKDLNAIYALVQRSMRNLTFGGYMVDCASIERLGYGGDGTASALSLQAVADASGMYLNWLQAWADAQQPDGGLPHTAPNPYTAGGGPYWCSFLVQAAWRTYMSYADKRPLERFYPAMKHWLDYVDAYTVDGLLKAWPDEKYRGWYLGDWAAPEGVDVKDPASIDLISNCTLCQVYGDLEQIALVLGKEADAASFRQRFEALRTRIQESFYHPGTATYASGSQIDMVFPLLCCATPDKERARVIKALKERTASAYDGHLSTGLVGVPVITEWATLEGETDWLYSLLKKRSYPGYLYMVDSGATGVWEEWNGGRSHLHNCYNGIGSWFSQALGGIRPLEPGYRRVRIEPHLPAGVDGVKVTQPTPYGPITVEVRGGEVRYQVPVGVEVMDGCE